MRRASAIYEGWVIHRRRRPIEHEFRYRVFMPLFDLDELPELLDPFPLWSARRPAPAWFRRSDFLGDAAHADCRGRPRAQLGARRTAAGWADQAARPPPLPRGRVQSGELPCSATARTGELDSVIAEVTNTPWGERHAYVLDASRAAARGRRDGGRATSRSACTSPRSWAWTRSTSGGPRLPGTGSGSGSGTWKSGEVIFEASLSLRRREMSRRLMARMLLTYPPMTIATLARIYIQALRLRIKGAPWFAHSESAA